MSLVLNMIGGGGSFTATDAILRVQAPSGSTVTITKGSTTKSDFGHPNVARPTIYDYYFIIHQSQFDSVNPWTVTATRGTDSNTTTIIINASDEYDLSFSYHVPINTYQEVEYLESTGTQYILAGLTSSNIDGYDCGFQFTEQYSGSSLYCVCGSRYQVSSHKEFISIAHWEGNIYFDPISDGSIPMDTNRHTAQVGNKFNWKAFVDGNEVGSTVGGLPTGTYNVDNFALFASRSKVSASSTRTEANSKVRIYHLTLYLGNTVQREFYPCYRLSDSVAGMYDKANNVFYTNNGSGVFTVGSDV